MDTFLIAIIACGGIVAVILIIFYVYLRWCSKSEDDKQEEAPILVSTKAAAAQSPRSRYHVMNPLGQGTYGVVYAARRTTDGRRVAIKVIPCKNDTEADEAMKEYNACQAVQGHPNVVQLLELFIDIPDPHFNGAAFGAAGLQKQVVLQSLKVKMGSVALKYICIVTELYKENTLFDLLAQRTGGELPEKQIWSYAEQLFGALAFMHERSLIHRDLKPSNVLMADKRRKIVLTDFGLSRWIKSDEYAQTRIGTMQYMAPEQMQRHYNHQSDVWAAGCLVYAMCSARVVTKTVRVMYRDRMDPRFEEELNREIRGYGYSEALAHFVLSLLQAQPNDRPTSAEACQTAQKNFAA